MTAKEQILGRIREALKEKAPYPGHSHDHHGSSTSAAPSAASARQWLPKAGSTPAEWLALFQSAASDLKAEVVLVQDRSALAESLRGLSETNRWQKIGIHSGVLTDVASAALRLPECRTDTSFEARQLENCDAGITECDALIGQTGSVLLTNRSAGGRALSVLPPHHVVLATKEQLVPDLVEAFSLLKGKYASNYPSFISFISGPSRTGDIERILVLGAHGPKRLTIFLLESDPT